MERKCSTTPSLGRGVVRAAGTSMPEGASVPPAVYILCQVRERGQSQADADDIEVGVGHLYSEQGPCKAHPQEAETRSLPRQGCGGKRDSAPSYSVILTSASSMGPVTSARFDSSCTTAAHSGLTNIIAALAADVDAMAETNRNGLCADNQGFRSLSCDGCPHCSASRSPTRTRERTSETRRPRRSGSHGSRPEPSFSGLIFLPRPGCGVLDASSGSVATGPWSKRSGIPLSPGPSRLQ